LIELDIEFGNLWDEKYKDGSTPGNKCKKKSIHKANLDERLLLNLKFDENIILH
jgi:hypothetical protein